MVDSSRVVVRFGRVFQILEIAEVQALAVDRDLRSVALSLIVPRHALSACCVRAQCTAVAVVLCDGRSAKVLPGAVQAVAIFVIDDRDGRVAPQAPQEQV